MKMSYYLSRLKKTKREYFESLSWNAFRGGAGVIPACSPLTGCITPLSFHNL